METACLLVMNETSWKYVGIVEAADLSSSSESYSSASIDGVGYLLDGCICWGASNASALNLNAYC